MEQGFFDHVFYWTFVVACLLTAVDWLIGPEGRSAMRERVGLWWLHVSETTFSGLVAEDAARVKVWLQSLFGPRWFSLRAILLCFGISFVASLAIWLGSVMASYAQAEIRDGPVNLPSVVVKVVLGLEVAPEDLDLGPEESEMPPEDRAETKEAFLMEIEASVRDARPILKHSFYHGLLPLIALNAVLDWVSLGATLVMLGWMTRSSRTLQLTGIVVLDLALAIGLAVAVGLGAMVYYLGLSEFTQVWISEFSTTWSQSWLVLERIRDLYTQLGIWDGMIAVPLAILFTSALPTLVHLVVALVFLSSKLFRPLLQPLVGRVLYLFHASKKGVLTQVAVGGGILIKAGQETIKYFAA